MRMQRAVFATGMVQRVPLGKPLRDLLAVGAEPVIHADDLRRCLTVVVGHDRRSWRCDCSI
jgi:hypothetical protein